MQVKALPVPSKPLLAALEALPPATAEDPQGMMFYSLGKLDPGMDEISPYGIVSFGFVACFKSSIVKYDEKAGQG